MIFECADHTFKGVAVVSVRGNKLEVNVLFAEGFLHGVGALIVNYVESGGYTVLLYVFVVCRPGCSDIQGLSVIEKLGVDAVGVLVVEDKYVLVIT